MFLIKQFFLYDQKVIFEGLSLKQIKQFFLEDESPTLKIASSMQLKILASMNFSDDPVIPKHFAGKS